MIFTSRSIQRVVNSFIRYRFSNDDNETLRKKYANLDSDEDSLGAQGRNAIKSIYKDIKFSKNIIRKLHNCMIDTCRFERSPLYVTMVNF